MKEYATHKQLSRRDWEHLRGTNIGTGSGAKLDFDEIRRTGQTVTGYELIELFSAMVKGRPFSFDFLLEGLNYDLQEGLVRMIERPTSNNEFGRFNHPVIGDRAWLGSPPKFVPDSWFDDVLNGRDPGLHA